MGFCVRVLLEEDVFFFEAFRGIRGIRLFLEGFEDFSVGKLGSVDTSTFRGVDDLGVLCSLAYEDGSVSGVDKKSSFGWLEL